MIRHWKFYLSAVLFILLSTSCNIVKPYTSPVIGTDSLYRGDGFTDESSFGSLKWREVFTDSLLQELIAEGISNNLDLQIAYARVRQSEAYYMQSRSALYPTLSSNLSVTESRLSEAQGFGIRTYMSQFNLGVTSIWEADIWGRLSSAKRSQRAQMLRSEAEAKAVQSGLVANIASLYYKILALDQQKIIIERTIDNWDSTIETMEKLKIAARVTEAAVVQSKARRAVVQIHLLDIIQQIREVENALSILVARDPQSIVRNSLHCQNVPDELRTGLPIMMLANRPDVNAAELNYRSTFEITNVSRATFYPTLILSGSARLNSLSIDKLINPASVAASIAGGLTQPLFNRRLLKTNLKVSEEEQLQAFLKYKNILLTAGREVTDALSMFKITQQKIELRNEQVAELHKSVIYTEKLLVNGFAGYLEVIDAHQELLSAEIGTVEAKMQQLYAVVGLYRALGGGWN